MLGFINKIVVYVDFISETPHILLDKSSRAKTIYGGILSTITVLLIFSAFITFALDLFNKNTKTMTYNLTPVTNVSYNYGQFPWMVALLDNGLKLLPEDDRYYTFYADIWNFYPDNSTGSVVMGLKRTPVKTERCDIDKHFGNYKDYFKDVPYLNYHYCPVPNQNITLYGIYGSIKPYNFLDFWISTCVNDTNRNNCYSKEVSKSRLVNTYISYQSLENFIDHSNLESPGQLILRSDILPVSSTIYKRDFFYIRNIEYRSDEGLIFSDTKYYSYSQISNFRETADLRPEGTVPGSFALITIMMDSKVDDYLRRFSKFQEVLANLGGLFKGLVVISYIVNFIFFNELYYLKLVSGLFETDFDDKNQNEVGLDKIENFSNLRIPKLGNISCNKILINDLSVLKKPPDPGFSIKNNKDTEERHKLNNFNIIYNKLKCFNKEGRMHDRIKMYNMAKNYTEDQLCIKNILNK